MGFELIARLNPAIINGTRKEEDLFGYNKDAGMFNSDDFFSAGRVS